MRAASGAMALFVTVLAVGCGRGPQPPGGADLIAMLQKDDPEAQIPALQWVVQLGPKAADAKTAVIAALKSQNPSVRSNAAVALRHLGPSAAEAVPALTLALTDAEVSVRQAAAETLGEIGSPAASALPELERLSRRPDPCNMAPAAIKKIRGG